MRVSLLLKELNISFANIVAFVSQFNIEINDRNQKIDFEEFKLIKEIYLNPEKRTSIICSYIDNLLINNKAKAEEVIFLLWIKDLIISNNYKLNIQQIANQILKHPQKINTVLYKLTIEDSNKIIKELSEKITHNYNNKISQILFKIWLESNPFFIEINFIKTQILYFILDNPNEINNIIKRLSKRDIIELVSAFFQNFDKNINFIETFCIERRIDFKSIFENAKNNEINLESLLLFMNFSHKSIFKIRDKEIQITQVIRDVYKKDYIGADDTYFGFEIQFEIDIEILIENELDIMKYFVNISKHGEYEDEIEYTKFIVRKTSLSDVKNIQNPILLFYVISKIESVFNNPSEIKENDFYSVNFKMIFDLESKLIDKNRYGIFISIKNDNQDYVKKFKNQIVYTKNNRKYDVKLLPFGNINLFSENVKISRNENFKGYKHLKTVEKELVFEGKFDDCNIIFNEENSLNNILEIHFKNKEYRRNLSNDRTDSNVDWDLWNNDLDADQQDPDFWNQF